MLFHLPRFVDKLYTIQPGENESYLPSPEALREKILVKVSDVNFPPLLEFYSRIPIQMLQCNSCCVLSITNIVCRHGCKIQLHFSNDRSLCPWSRQSAKNDSILYYTILYYTILYYTILYYTILYYTILYYTILCYAMLCYAMLCYTMLCDTILYYILMG